jgi:hypothetical protein
LLQAAGVRVARKEIIMVQINFVRWAPALLAAGLGIAGCSTTGEVVGQLQEPDAKQEPVVLVWHASPDSPLMGKISGTLPNHLHYTGKYFEVVQTAPVDIYEPLWDGWSPYWPAWPPSGYTANDALDAQGFMRVYTGKVVANLRSDDNTQKLRCRFTLESPRRGLAGGGQGDCQLSNGEKISNAKLVSM